jgi:kumamolisin
MQSVPPPASILQQQNLMERSGRPTSVLGSISKSAAIALIAVLQTGSPARAQSVATRTTFTDSIKEPAKVMANMASVAKNVPSVVRSELTDAETQATIDFSIALKMRDFAELQHRVGTGEIISLDEMNAKYFPTSAEVTSVRQWLAAQGFEVQPSVTYELSVFARGTVAQLQRAFAVTFGRVQFAGEEHTSALTAPSLPTDIANPVLSINGLQPHLHPFVHSIRKPAVAGKLISNRAPYLVPEIAKAYDASIGDGTGQKIAIVIDTFPNDSDLTSFWTDNSIPQSLNNIEKVQVVAGTLPAPSGEETLDVSWTSGIASAAKIRVYATRSLAFARIDQAYQQIINDLPSQPALHQVSMSFGIGETFEALGQMQTDSQYFSAIAGDGVTVFVSSGDGGSNPGTDGGYSPSNPVQVESPANDPSVTAVGGTSLFLNQSTGVPSSETVWFEGGGGQSTIFSRPYWQQSTGIPGSGRLVPDVALAADPNTGAFLILNGAIWQVGGTSWSAPTWAGFCARINQIRAGNGASSVRLLSTRIYPYVGPAFRDITFGSNGAYNAGIQFDLCTGFGTPDVNNLGKLLSGIPKPPVAKDFNGDRSADLVWENGVTGERSVFLTNGGVPAWTFSLSTVGPSWHIVGVGDFLGDGRTGLVWENTTTGARGIWVLQDGTLSQIIQLPTEPTSWHIVGAADFDGDGQADLVWENSLSGERGIWLLKRGALSRIIPLPTEPTSWHIAGAADFDGDGQADLVWENSVTGVRGIWLLKRGALSRIIPLPTEPTSWHIAGAADFDGDGQADLIWENTVTGEHGIWFLKAGGLNRIISLPTEPTSWHIVDH